MKQHYRIEISVKKFWLLLLPIVVLLAVGFGVLSYFVVDKVVMPGVTGMSNKGVVIIPEVTGMSLKEAKKLCYDRGLLVSENESEYSDSVDVGVILSQEPEVGKSVKKGRHIFVVTSKGSEIDTVPDVKEMLEGPAKIELRKAGFRRISVRSEYNDRIEQNMVVRTYPEKGTVTSREAEIVLSLSKGARPTHAVVPNMVGEMLSVARSLVEEAGLEIGSITYSSSSVMSPGQVIKQSAASGAKIPLESRVDLVVAKQ